MSLTFVNEPVEYNSAYRPVKWAVETTVVGLRVVQFELFDNDTATLLDTKVVQQNVGSTDTFSADFRSIIQTSLGFDINLLLDSGLGINSNSLARKYYVVTTEDANSTGSYSFTGATKTSAIVRILNNSLQVGEPLPTATGHIKTTSGVKHLSNKPIYITRTAESEFTTIYNNTESVKLTVIVTDKNGATTSGIVNSITLGNVFSYIGIGYKNVNSYTLDTGSQPLLDADSRSYTVALETVSTGNTFETLSIEIDIKPLSDFKRFLFQNKYGAPDYFTAYRAVEKSQLGTSSEVIKPISDFTDPEDYGLHKPSSSMATSYRVLTQSLSRPEIVWLEEMKFNSNLFEVDGVNNMRIVINDDEMLVFSSYTGQEVFDLEFTYKSTNALRRQSR